MQIADGPARRPTSRAGIRAASEANSTDSDRSRLADVEIGLEDLGDPVPALFEMGPARVVDRRGWSSRGPCRSGRRSPSGAAGPAHGRRPGRRVSPPRDEDDVGEQVAGGVRAAAEDHAAQPAEVLALEVAADGRAGRPSRPCRPCAAAEVIEVRPDAVGQRPEDLVHPERVGAGVGLELLVLEPGQGLARSGSGPGRSSGCRGSARAPRYRRRRRRSRRCPSASTARCPAGGARPARTGTPCR